MANAADHRAHPPGRPLRARILVIGLLCAAFVSLAFPYANLVVRGSRPANTSLPFGAVAIWFLLALCNPLLARLSRRLSLSREAMLIVFAMVLIAAAVPTWGLIGQLLPIMTGLQYYATEENRWTEMLLPHVPEWMVPVDLEVSRQFYEGMPPGARVPWGAWALPLASWAVMVAAFYSATIGIMLLLRRQWVDRERLIYPLMRLPLELADNRGGGLPAILRNPLLWIGVGIALAPTVLNGLHFYLPGVPQIRMNRDIVIPMQRESFLLRLWLNPAVAGFSYVVSADLGFTLWFFALVAGLQTPLMRLAGVGLGAKEVYCAGSPAVSYQAMGAMILLVLTALWSARELLSDMWAAAWGRRELKGQEQEPCHPATAWALAVGGLLALGAWLVATGVPPLGAAVFLLSAFVNFIALSRSTVQGGVPVTRAALIPQSLTAHSLGSRYLGPGGLLSLGYAFAWTADIRVTLMTYFAHALKLWSEAGSGEEGRGEGGGRREATAAGWKARPTNGGESCPTNGGEARPTNGSKARPTNGSKARPTNGSEARPTNDGEARPTNGSEARLTDEQRRGPRPRGLLGATALTLLVGAVGATWITLHYAYSRGGVSLSSWLFAGNPTSAFQYVASQIQTPAEPGLARFSYLGIGAGVMWLLTAAHRSFLWWPLHPLGFAVAATQPVQDLWLPILIGWALKALALRYGGYRTYQAGLPVLLGVILGQSLGCAGWLVVDAITGTTGNLIYVY